MVHPPPFFFSPSLLFCTASSRISGHATRMSWLRVGVTWPRALTPLASTPIAASLAAVAWSQQRAAPDRLLTWSCEIRGLVHNVTNRFRDFMSVARSQGRLAILQRYPLREMDHKRGGSVTFGGNVLCGFGWTFDPPRFSTAHSESCNKI